MDRSFRDAAHSLENSFFVSGDWVPFKDLLIRLSYRHSDRKPDVYQDDNAVDPVSRADVTCADTTTVSFTSDQRCSRRFDEAARLRNKSVKSSLKTAVRRFREAADAGDREAALAAMATASRELDKAASKGVIHANQAANKKSAMALKANSL